MIKYRIVNLGTPECGKVNDSVIKMLLLCDGMIWWWARCDTMGFIWVFVVVGVECLVGL